MSKERLEEIKERVLVDMVYYKYLDGTEGHWGKVYTLSEEDYNYLIERVQELERKIERYREALEFLVKQETLGKDVKTGKTAISYNGMIALKGLGIFNDDDYIVYGVDEVIESVLGGELK